MKTTANCELNPIVFRTCRSVIKQTINQINNYLKISKTIHQKFKSSSYQEKFSLSLTLLHDNLNDSGLDLILEDCLMDLEKLNNFHDFRDSSLDKHIKKIILNAEVVEDYILEFLMKKDWKHNIINFIWNDSFASLSQLRVELMMMYNVDEFTIETKDKKVLDMYHNLYQYLKKLEW
jgi:hypothetical protein